MSPSKLYLVGFMAAGKTTVARALARALGWEAVDTDALVEAREGTSIADIFSTRGEPAFRAAERAVLEALTPRDRLVVATGGGLYVDPENQALIDRDGVAIWLDVSLKRVIERLPQDGRRPLAADRAGLERLYQARQSAYRQAHLRLDADDAGPDELVERVREWLARQPRQD